VGTVTYTGERVIIHIPRRATATQAAQLLLTGGVIDDLNDFVAYMVNVRVTHRILYGTFTFPTGAVLSYEEIVDILTM
jgi:hypothetical protein